MMQKKAVKSNDAKVEGCIVEVVKSLKEKMAPMSRIERQVMVSLLHTALHRMIGKV